MYIYIYTYVYVYIYIYTYIYIYICQIQKKFSIFELFFNSCFNLIRNLNRSTDPNRSFYR